jgi:hypothetical protein
MIGNTGKKTGFWLEEFAALDPVIQVDAPRQTPRSAPSPSGRGLG